MLLLPYLPTVTSPVPTAPASANPDYSEISESAAVIAGLIVLALPAAGFKDFNCAVS